MNRIKRIKDKDANLELGRRKKVVASFLGGKEEVDLERVEADHFILPIEKQIAKYKPEVLARHWNEENNQFRRKPNIFKRLWKSWKQGIWGQTALVVAFYLVAYYVFNIAVIQFLCARDDPLEYTIVNPGTEMLLNALANNANSSA